MTLNYSLPPKITMKHLLITGLIAGLLSSPLTSNAGNVAYIHGDISEAGFTPASTATSGANTPYDQMLLTDTGNLGLSIFRDLVEEQGHSIGQYYDQDTELNASFLNDKDVLVFGLHQKLWSNAEKSALDTWLRNGGGMLVYSDSASGGFHRIVGAQNPVGQTVSNNLISDYGIEIMVDQANGAPSADALDNASIVGLRGLTLMGEGVSPIAFTPGDSNVEVLIPYDGPIRTNDGLTISNPEYAALALRPVGDGHVMALFDRQPIWNNGNGANIQDADNQDIFVSIINFLALRTNETSTTSSASVSASPQQYHKVTLDWQGPSLSENSTTFRDYRLDVTFTSPSNISYVVPGYFAADGDAAETSEDSGNIWRAHINPDETGVWRYSASFRTGENIAIDLDTSAGSPFGNIDGSSGSFTVSETDKSGIDFRGKGKLAYVGEHFLQFSNQEFFLKVGANSPEAFLEYEDFDNTNSNRSYSTHDGSGNETDGIWRAGDPTWQSDKGRGIIGAVNYLAEVGMNVHYFLTMNIEGDGRRAYPYPADDTPFVFDVSKLAQWQIVFDHMMSQGVMTHFVLSETENESWFEYLESVDTGVAFSSIEFADSRKLFYREMVARFGYLNAITWNIGEENGWSTTNRNTFGRPTTNSQRIAYANYLDRVNPYNDHIVVHNQPNIDDIYADLYAEEPTSYTGTSYQEFIDRRDQLRSALKTIIRDSAAAGRKWVVAYDEAFTTTRNPDIATVRKELIWSTFMLGGAGVEYYIPRDDIIAENYRDFSQYWEAMDHAYDFFIDNDIPFWAMSEADALTDRGFALAQTEQVYVLYLPDGGAPTLTLPGSDNYQVQWYNPREGGVLQSGSVGTVQGGGPRSLGLAPNDTNNEWVVLLRNQGDNNGNFSPSINISSPINGTSFDENETVNIVATASDFDGTVSQVEFLLNGSPISAPDTSAPFTASFTAGIAGTYTITARATDNDGSSSTNSIQIIVIDPSNSSPFRAPDVPSGALFSGVEYDYFKFEQLNDLNSINDLVGEPFDSGSLTQGPSLEPAEADPDNFNNFGFIFTGFIEVPTDGIYTFFTTSNDGNDLFIGDEQIINNDGPHIATEVSAEVGLQAGVHEFTLRYYQSGGTTTFINEWQGPGFSRQLIPATAWRYENPDVAANIEPSVSITSPINNSEFEIGSSITISANANDPDGEITRVEFYINDSLVSSDLSAPYNFTWPNVAEGSYVVSAIAFDDSSATTLSQSINISVLEGADTPTSSNTEQLCFPIRVEDDRVAVICL